MTTTVKHGIIITFSILHMKKENRKDIQLVIGSTWSHPILFGPYPVASLGISAHSDRLTLPSCPSRQLFTW